MDRERLLRLVASLREKLPYLPADPYLLYATDVQSGEFHGEDRLPANDVAMAAILEAGRGRDLVGIYAAGGIYAGWQTNRTRLSAWVMRHLLAFLLT